MKKIIREIIVAAVVSALTTYGGVKLRKWIDARKVHSAPEKTQLNEMGEKTNGPDTSD